MTANISSIPFLGGKGTLRDDILNTLSKENFLTAKEIFTRVKRQGEKDVTYQAVHKTIKQMVEKKVLMKEKQHYSIAKEWVEQAKGYLMLMESTYHKTPTPAKVLGEMPGPVNLRFTQYSDLCVFVAKLLVEYREKKKIKLPHYVILWHLWWPLKFEFSMWDLFNKMDDQNPDNRVVVSQDTAFDKMIGTYYRLSNSADRLLVGLPKKERVEEDIMVRGDLVIQVHYSEKTRKELHRIFSQINSLTDLFHMYFIQGKSDGPFDIDVTISENPAMAKLFREKVKGYFGEQ